MRGSLVAPHSQEVVFRVRGVCGKLRVRHPVWRWLLPEGVLPVILLSEWCGCPDYVRTCPGLCPGGPGYGPVALLVSSHPAGEIRPRPRAQVPRKMSPDEVAATMP